METCANCNAALTGPYCSACGCKRLSAHDFSIGHFFTHLLHDLTHFDAKIIGSFVPLLFKPGFLTVEFMAGRWSRYIKPVTLFILLNVFFFFAKGGIFNWTADTYIDAAGTRAAAMVEQRAEVNVETVEKYKEHFTEVARQVQHSMFFIAIPVLGLAMKALFRRRYLVEHIVYSVHYHAFLLFFLAVALQFLYRWILYPLVQWGVLPPDYFKFMSGPPGLDILVFTVVTFYQFLAVRRVYQLRPIEAVGLAGALTAGEYAFLVYAYQPAVFYYVYYIT